VKKIILWLVAHWPFFRKWFGEGNSDDFRNPLWRASEGPLRVNVLWAITLLDLRIIYHRRDGKWILAEMYVPYATRQNFWNAFFSLQVYLVGWKCFAWPKVNVVFRPVRDWWFEASTPGVLFDSGFIHAKFAIFNWQREQIEGQGGDAWAWEEGTL
jgi:hypothetical protein